MSDLAEIMYKADLADMANEAIRESERRKAMEYTKGEWKYNPMRLAIEARLIGEDGFVNVCDISPQSPHTEEIANAQLISAAPDLYETLKVIVCGNPDYVPRDEDWENAEKALAKAEGK